MIPIDMKLLKMVQDDCRKIAKYLHKEYYGVNMSEEDILELAYWVVMNLLNRYRSLPDGVGLAPRSFYFRYAQGRVKYEMIKEYRRQERGVSLEGLLTEISGEGKEPDGTFSNRGFGRSAFIRTIDNRERVRAVMRRANRLDRKIMRMVMAGYTHSEIARRFCLSRRNISKRLKKYRRFF